MLKNKAASLVASALLLVTLSCAGPLTTQKAVERFSDYFSTEIQTVTLGEHIVLVGGQPDDDALLRVVVVDKKGYTLVDESSEVSPISSLDYLIQLFADEDGVTAIFRRIGSDWGNKLAAISITPELMVKRFEELKWYEGKITNINLIDISSNSLDVTFNGRSVVIPR